MFVHEIYRKYVSNLRDLYLNEKLKKLFWNHNEQSEFHETGNKTVYLHFGKKKKDKIKVVYTIRVCKLYIHHFIRS